MQISEALREKFINRDGQKILTLQFPEIGLTIGNENIYSDTLKITESILENETIEWVGCIASNMTIDLHGITAQLKGKRIIAYITIEGFENEQIRIFTGYVDSVKTRLSDSYKSITCYDDLYYKASDVDVAQWYESLSFPTTIKNIRDSLFGRLGIAQVETNLINDDVIISKQYNPKEVNALDIIKNICQFNAVFGIINRSGQFEYRGLSGEKGHATGYPSMYTFPSLDMYPTDGTYAVVNNGSDDAVVVSYYRDMEYEDFDVYAIDKVLVRDSEDVDGRSYGTGTNTYVVQGNVFAYGLSDDVLDGIAERIFDSVKGFSYRPFNSKAVGLPFVEVGTKVTFYIEDYTSGNGEFIVRSFYVMSRDLNGVQELTDDYQAEGEQYQKTFVSDLNTKLDLIEKAESEEMYEDFSDDISSLDERVTALEEGGGGGFNVLSVTELPYEPKANTIYLVQGEILSFYAESE